MHLVETFLDISVSSLLGEPQIQDLEVRAMAYLGVLFLLQSQSPECPHCWGAWERSMGCIIQLPVLPEGGAQEAAAGALAVASRSTSPRVAPRTQCESQRPQSSAFAGISSELWVVPPLFHRRGPWA